MSNRLDKVLILNEIKSYYNFNSDTDFANFLGIKPQTLSSWKVRNTFDAELIYAKCVNIDANFLLTGRGSMIRKDKDSKHKNPSTDDNSNNRVNAEDSIKNNPYEPSPETANAPLIALLAEKNKQITNLLEQIDKLVEQQNKLISKL